MRDTTKMTAQEEKSSSKAAAKKTATAEIVRVPATAEIEDTEANPIAELIAKRLDEGVSRVYIAEMAGFKQHNMVSILKRGIAKLPLDRVPGMARGLGVDPYYLFRLALNQYSGKAKDELNEILDHGISANEKRILRYIREQSGEKDPGLTPKLESAIFKAFK